VTAWLEGELTGLANAVLVEAPGGLIGNLFRLLFRLFYAC